MPWLIISRYNASAFFFTSSPSFAADESVRIHVTMLKASNVGSDFNLENDTYKDQLIKLFAYSSYRQLDKFVVDLKKAERKFSYMFGGYELVVTLQGEEKNRVLVEVLIRKEGRTYVSTVLSVLKPGVAFLGGPPLGDGDLILAVEVPS